MPDHVGQTLGFQGVAVIRSPAVLPYYGVVDGLSRLGIPYYRGFPLVGDSDAGNVEAVDAH